MSKLFFGETKSYSDPKHFSCLKNVNDFAGHIPKNYRFFDKDVPPKKYTNSTEVVNKTFVEPNTPPKSSQAQKLTELEPFKDRGNL